VRYVTAVASESRTHLTDNGAVTLCGRAITHTWRRSGQSDDRVCDECRTRVAAMEPVLVAARHESAGRVDERAVPA
jgi:hypothetical protein